MNFSADSNRYYSHDFNCKSSQLDYSQEEDGQKKTAHTIAGVGTPLETILYNMIQKLTVVGDEGYRRARPVNDLKKAGDGIKKQRPE